MQKILTVCDLKKSYGRVTAVDGVSFHILQGEMLAMLGPNGAGKSTVINILSTAMEHTDGSVVIDGAILGKHNRQIRRKIGVVFQKGVLDEMLTVEDNILSRAALYGLRGKARRDRVAQIGEMTGISSLMKRRYGSLSGGQQRRCDIARALAHRPKLLFLDEPAAGLDPEMRASLWKTIDDIRRRIGMTVLLTTHDMDEAVRADRIMIMNKGKIVAEGTPECLRRQFVKDRLVLFSENPASLISLLEQNGSTYIRADKKIELPLQTTMDALSILESCRGRYADFEVIKGSLENAYISIMEREHPDD